MRNKKKGEKKMGTKFDNKLVDNKNANGESPLTASHELN